jgi:uncharacterized 2Fe-2S/4Fe-4S cluster protein (DUF4445 family)
MADQTIHFQPFGRKVALRRGATVLGLAGEAGVSIESICGSAGKCGKCRVTVTSGAESLSEVNEVERKLLDDKDLGSGTRLSCQAVVTGAGRVTVDVPEESRREHHRLLAAGVDPKVRLRPAVAKVLLTVPPATLRDTRADDDRLMSVLRKKARKAGRMGPGVHAHLPAALRDGAWQTTVTMFREDELIRVEPGDTTDRLYGVSADIGTTKVVAYLIDLRTGAVVSTESMPNPQIPYGEDLMSRISFATRDPEGGRRLQKAVVNGLNTLIGRLCENAGTDRDDVLEVMVVGNTAMHHMFFGIPSQHLAKSPYAPVVRTSLTVNATHAGIDIYPFGKVSSLPNIAGFVGADAVADLLASGLHKDRDIGMMIDIGTNTEIVAGNRDRLISCSCASGPAFEGAHIRFGMRASTGAIERIWIDPATKDVLVRTVEDKPPKGICGSGIVDAVSELLKTDMIDPSGRLDLKSGARGIRRNSEGVPEFVLVHAKDTAMGEDITVTQHDIQEIQLAKAAIFTGVSMLMRRLRVRCTGLRRVYAAGAFGTYVDAGSAINIGMYPDVPVESIRFIGNAAGAGARMTLRSVDARDLAERLSKEVEYIELAAEKDFQLEFAKAMYLPHREPGRFPNHGRAGNASPRAGRNAPPEPGSAQRRPVRKSCA